MGVNSVSAVQGWKLLALCVATFPPTNSVEDFLFKYLYDQYSGPDQVRIFAPWCFWRMSKTIKVGPSKHPPTIADLDNMATNGVRPSSVLFGGSLEYIVYLQKVQGSSLDVPEIIPRLCEMIETNGGFQTKGIFRIAAEKSEIHHLRHSVHEGKYEYKKTNDPHVPADVLKHWLRDLLEPLFPVAMYDQCLKASDSVPNCVALCQTLPKAHYDTCDWLMTWLVGLAKHQSVTAMNEDNIAIVFCQDILRTTETDPQALLKNSAKEKNFVCHFISYSSSTYNNQLATNLCLLNVVDRFAMYYWDGQKRLRMVQMVQWHMHHNKMMISQLLYLITVSLFRYYYNRTVVSSIHSFHTYQPTRA
jgi:hypothetical protein